MKTERWGGAARGRSSTVARGDTVWTVSNARNLGAGFPEQVAETFEFLDASLRRAGSDKSRLLSVQVILVDMADRDAFNELWCSWIGDNPEHWPQRAVIAAALAPGLLVEIIATASRDVGADPAEA